MVEPLKLLPDPVRVGASLVALAERATSLDEELMCRREPHLPASTSISRTVGSDDIAARGYMRLDSMRVTSEAVETPAGCEMYGVPGCSCVEELGLPFRLRVGEGEGEGERERVEDSGRTPLNHLETLSSPLSLPEGECECFPLSRSVRVWNIAGG